MILKVCGALWISYLARRKTTLRSWLLGHVIIVVTIQIANKSTGFSTLLQNTVAKLLEPVFADVGLAWAEMIQPRARVERALWSLQSESHLLQQTYGTKELFVSNLYRKPRPGKLPDTLHLTLLHHACCVLPSARCKLWSHRGSRPALMHGGMLGNRKGRTKSTLNWGKGQR